jgi:hypothetical protein
MYRDCYETTTTTRINSSLLLLSQSLDLLEEKWRLFVLFVFSVAVSRFSFQGGVGL